MTPFIVMDVLEKANEMERKGAHIIHLEVGEPDFNTPSCITKAIKDAYNQGITHYTHSLGDPELREEIARFYKKEYDVTVDPDCIVVTSGSSPAILLALMLLCDNEKTFFILSCSDLWLCTSRYGTNCAFRFLATSSFYKRSFRASWRGVVATIAGRYLIVILQ